MFERLIFILIEKTYRKRYNYVWRAKYDKARNQMIVVTNARHGNDKTEGPEESVQEKRDPKDKIRIVAANMVCVNNESIQHTADSLMQYLD